MTTQHTDEMREAFEKPLQPFPLRWSRWEGKYAEPMIQFRYECFVFGYQAATTRCEQTLRVALAALKSGNHSHKIGAISAIQNLLGETK